MRVPLSLHIFEDPQPLNKNKSYLFHRPNYYLSKLSKINPSSYRTPLPKFVFKKILIKKIKKKK
jgi:hypothetical protein